MLKILRFTASWCAPCKSLAKNLEEANLGLPIEVVDIDVYNDVAMEYGVRSIPTLVLMGENNTVIRRITGAKTVNELRTWFTEAPIPV